MPYRPEFEVRDDGTLLIGGLSVERLAKRVGSTPFFAYDRAQLTKRIATLRRELPRDLELGYAIKANPMPALVQHLSGLVDKLDVASGAELKLALDTPTPPESISFAGPGKSLAELSQAVAAGVIIEMESSTEASRVVRIGNDMGIRPRVAIRVNPDFSVKRSGMRMGGGGQQFGIDSEEVPAVIRDLMARQVDLVGFHLFAGSQNLFTDTILEAQTMTVDLLLRLADHLPGPVRYLNVGGGLGIPYYDKERPIDLPAIGENMEKLIRGRIRPLYPDAHIVMELGRYIVGECGIYVTRVVDRKVSRGKTFVIVDGGMHHQMAASGNFGQVFRRNYPIAVANRVDPVDFEQVQVVGCLCTPLDLLGDGVHLPQAEIGDLIVLFQAGAYGLTASPTSFLSHSAPQEVLV